jgi:putative lipoprotein
MRKIALIFFLLILFLKPCEENHAQDKNGACFATSPFLLKERVRFVTLDKNSEITVRLFLKGKNTGSKVKEDKWLGWDKFGHFFISGFLAGASYSIYHENFNNDKESSVYFASIFTLSLGIGKEVNDSKKPQNKFSYKDLIFDILGISSGLLIATN